MLPQHQDFTARRSVESAQKQKCSFEFDDVLCLWDSGAGEAGQVRSHVDVLCVKPDLRIADLPRSLCRFLGRLLIL